MRTRLSFLLTFALVLLRKDGVAKPLRAICGSGACDLEGRYIAGVLADAMNHLRSIISLRCKRQCPVPAR